MNKITRDREKEREKEKLQAQAVSPSPQKAIPSHDRQETQSSLNSFDRALIIVVLTGFVMKIMEYMD
jgi:hypothetical protein